MKRLNPKTKKPFTAGELRDDGFIFIRYILSRPIRANGTFVENWKNPERKGFGIKRINPLTQKFFKLGDISVCGAHKFKRYSGGTDTNGYSYEDWLAKEKYSDWLSKQTEQSKINKRKVRAKNKVTGVPKRVSPKTGEPFVRGEKFEGKRFIHYTNSAAKNGLMGEEWTDEGGWHRIGVSATRANRKASAGERGKLFNVTTEYLLYIFPQDNLCPIFKTPMIWGGHKDNSPSLDCIIPDSGYIEGNVAWICTRANVMKLGRNPEKLRKMANWIDQMLLNLGQLNE